MRGKPICHFCRHFDAAHYDQTLGYRCRAFPQVIPESIQNSRYDHQKPYPGDQGIQFIQYAEVSQLPQYLQETPEVRRLEAFANSLRYVEQESAHYHRPPWITWLMDTLTRWVWAVLGKILRK